MERIGILTAGGDAPGLNPAIRAVVLAGTLELGLQIIGIRNGFSGFADGDDGLVHLDRPAVRGILLRGGSILGCNNRFKAEPEYFAQRMREIGLDGLVVAGGDGSLTIANALASTGARVVGVPKTIDNDVAGTDQTFGFDTAVGVVADACHRLIDTAESHHRVMIAEVMGRDAGHIALHGALAGSADIALIPEIPFDPHKIAAVVEARRRRGRTYTMIVVAEGARRKGGGKVVDEYRTHLAQREVLGGVAASLADELRGLVHHEVRSLELEHLQRGGTPSVFDRLLATRMGVAAARALAEGESGVFAALRDGEIRMVPLSDAAGKIRTVDVHGDLVSSARAIGFSFGD